MTLAGIVVSAAIGIALLVWVANSIRRDRLYVGYGVIFIVGTLAAIIVLVVPALLAAVTHASVALMPIASLGIVPLALFMLLIVYLFGQITILANRVTRLTQEIAIRNAEREAEQRQAAGPR